MSSVKLENIKKSFGDFEALKGINLSVEPGEFIVMVGPSGCGKSTLLKAIAGLDIVSSGEIWIAGKNVTNAEPSDRGIAMVFQSYALYPHMSVAENMGFGLRLAKKPKAEIEAAVNRAAEILRLEDQLGKLPKQLSGGQRQRVAIGRAITRSPEVFLFDEPLSNLDAALRTQMRVELSSLHAQLESTMIYVTHDQVEAMTMADRIVVLNAGQIEQVGSPLELYTNPANLFVAGFLGAPRMNFFHAKVEQIDGDQVQLNTEGLPILSCMLESGGMLKLGDQVTAGVRPEKIQVSLKEDDVKFTAAPRLVEHLGRETIAYLDASPFTSVDSDTGTSNITMQLGQVEKLALDAQLTCGFSTDDLYVFGPDGVMLTPKKSI